MPVVTPAASLDRHAERGAEARVVLLVAHHQRDAQLVQPLARHRQADQAAPVARHEVDRLRSHLLRGDREIALVLAVLVVDDDDHLPGAEVLDRLRDGDGMASALFSTTSRGSRAGARRTWRSRPPRD
jgi:hypothetical protein